MGKLLAGYDCLETWQSLGEFGLFTHIGKPLEFVFLAHRRTPLHSSLMSPSNLVLNVLLDNSP